MGQSREWLAVDWGTSNVRLWRMRGDSVAGRACSDEGMAGLSPHGYPAVLGRLAGQAGAGLDLPVVVCGMAGARGGWREAGYCDVPCAPADVARGATGLGAAEGVARGFILPGLCQRTPGREEAMRGEETQIAGLLIERPDFEGVAVLPGTHSKWALVEKGRVSAFATAMTGELFALLGQHSVLRLTTGGDVDAADEERGFAEGLATGLAEPGRLLSSLFRVRAAGLVSQASAGWGRGCMSGLLIGGEIAGMAQRFAIAGRPVALVGDGGVARRYAQALAAAGAAVAPLSAEAATIRGLAAAWRHLARER